MGLVALRKLSARHAPGGGSTDPFVVRFRRRAIAWGVLVMLLPLRKLASVLRVDFEVVLAVVGALIAAALVVYFVRQARRREMPEPQDEDTELSEEAVEAALATGVLSPHDLVREGTVWTTLVQSARFGDAAGARDAVLQRRALAMKSVVIVVVVAAVSVASMALFDAGGVLTWLLAP